MHPKAPNESPSPDLFSNRLDNMLDQRHELYRLAGHACTFETEVN